MRQYIEKLIVLLGGFATVDQAIDSIKSEEEKHKILTRAVAKHFNTITKEDLFRKNDKGQYTFKGKPLMKEQVEYFKTQSKDFLESHLFKVLDAEVHYQATIKTFFNAKDEKDVREGKLIEWTWDIIKSKLNNF